MGNDQQANNKKDREFRTDPISKEEDGKRRNEGSNEKEQTSSGRKYRIDEYIERLR
ncbi:MAG: hypothetical protein PVG39_01345 [Desulfobacteraceae bacterium]|jgi:hypothetical protein